MKFTPALVKKLRDPDAEAVRANVDQRIMELQAMPAGDLRVIRNIEIGINGAVMVQHGIGRAPNFVWASMIRTTPAHFGALTVGVLVDAGAQTFNTGLPIDRSRVLQIGAFSFSTPIILDLAVL